MIFSKNGTYCARIPAWILASSVFLLAATGAYSTLNSVYAVVVMVSFGIVGYLLRKGGFPVSPMVIAYILGERIERVVRQSLLLSDDNPLIFFTRPISLAFLMATLAVIGPIYWSEKRSKRRSAE